MTALSADKDVQEKDSSFGQLVSDFGSGVVVDNTTIYKGALVCFDQNDSKVKEGATATTLIAMGVAREQVVTTTGDNASVKVESGIFKFENSAAGDAIADADAGNVCYIVDDQTVAKTNGGATRSVAGRVYAVDSDGVWVKVDPFEA